MQNTPSFRPPADQTRAAASAHGESLLADDAARLLRYMVTLAMLRNDPRSWRLKLLDQIMELLPATAACAIILKNVIPENPPVVVSLFDVGFKPGPFRQVFFQEFNSAPFRDPFARRALDQFISSRAETLTMLRSDLVDDPTWYADPQVQNLRRNVGIDDCILSLHRGTERGTACALYAFRPPLPSTSQGAPSDELGLERYRFTPRERTLLNVLHGGLDPLYRAEESTHRLNRAAELPPRLRQTLECLLAGNTERQAALKLSLSIHTVHDYVKSLYSHFGVSSRGELLSKWMQTSGQLPPPEKK